MLELPIRPTLAAPDNIPVLAAHSSLDNINTFISFTILPTFQSFGNLFILATPSTQPILANLLILPTNSSLYTIHIIVCNHIYTCFWLFLLDFPRLPTLATPDNIPVLATHSSLVTINTIISFPTLATFPTLANLNI